MRTPLLLLWVVVALAVILPPGRAQRSRGQSQARRPSTEAPAYDDYYYDEDGADEEAASKKPEKSSSSQSSSRGSSGSSGSSRGSKPEPPSDEDYDAPPPSPKSSSSSSTAKPSSSSLSKHKSGPSADAKPSAAAPASEPTDEPGAEEPPHKKGPLSPSTLFLAPRKNRLHRPNVHFAARPRPTLPSFIKHPPPLGAISTTVTPKPRSAAVAVTEEPKVTRSTAKPKISSASSKRGGNGGFSGGAAGRKRDRSTTESPASTDGDRSNRRFGGNAKSKNTSRPRFRSGSSA
ncbi:microtubule-associated protein RP/EB family member 1-like [Dermacentor albipictus]|uniref:microtubule-associated protein RP/EB family member 1-like n=1 Tax=Dermacentor albipictus TaxID=60249 RepID=UPI0031FCBD5D